MTSLHISFVAFVALSFSAIGLGGCAADAGDEDSTDTEVTVKTEEGAVAPAYVANVVRKDIVEGGGKCVGNLCTINGTMWDCSGGGKCATIK